MYKIIIVDDHAVVRQGVKSALSNDFPNVVFHEAINSNEMMRKITQSQYDVVILDISMPGVDGLSVLKEVKKDFPRLPVIIFTMNPEKEYAVRAFRGGASGFINKESDMSELVEALKKVLKGGKYITPSIAELLVANLDSNNDRPQHEKLSDREFQVLRLIAEGNTISEIAEKLCVSPNTVTTYRRRILDKMNFKSNAEITHYAIVNKLVS
jgi:two-component system, NarL family, invasion response regulator UvrY